jgi:CHASE2 domain-containing sensor protein
MAALPVAVALVVFVASWLYVLDHPARWARLETLTVRLAELGGPEGVHGDVAVVAIDSLDVVEQGEPWGKAWRPRMAELVDRVSEAGASVIALDVTFEDPTPDDDALAAAIHGARARGTHVFVGVAALDGGEPVLTPALRFAEWGAVCIASGAQQLVVLMVRKAGSGDPPLEVSSLPLRAVAAHRGLRITELDAGRRRVVLLDEGSRQTSIPFTALQTVRRDARDCPLLQEGDTIASLVVDYSRTGALRDARRRMAYGAVVGAEGAASRLRGKVVVVGSEPGDLVASLYPGLGGERRYGFELMADAISTLLLGRLVRPLPGWGSFLLMLAVAAAGAALAVWPRGASRWARRGALVAGVVLLLAGAVWAYRAAGVMILVIYPVLALFLGYWGMLTVRRWRFT